MSYRFGTTSLLLCSSTICTPSCRASPSTTLAMHLFVSSLYSFGCKYFYSYEKIIFEINKENKLYYVNVVWGQRRCHVVGFSRSLDRHTHSPYWSSSGSFAISSFHLLKINLIVHGSRPKRLSTSFGLAMCTVQWPFRKRILLFSKKRSLGPQIFYR
jgi:hypothetical protein